MCPGQASMLNFGPGTCPVTQRALRLQTFWI